MCVYRGRGLPVGSKGGLEVWEPSGHISVRGFICASIKKRSEYDLRIAVPQPLTRHWLCGRSIAKHKISFPSWSLGDLASIKWEPKEMWVSC